MKLEFAFETCQVTDHICEMHTHKALELVYYVEGEGFTTVRDSRYRVERHVFTVTPSGVLHDQENQTNVTSLCFGMSGSGLESLEGGWRDRDGSLLNACERLLAEANSGLEFSDTIRDGILCEITGLVRRACSSRAPTDPKAELVGRAITLIRTVGGKLSVADLSERLFISKDYLRHLFLEYSDNSPIQHIINARIEKAKTLLLTRPDQTVSQISEDTGFDNPYYFSRLFKKITGATPTQFRTSTAKSG